MIHKSLALVIALLTLSGCYRTVEISVMDNTTGTPVVGARVYYWESYRLSFLVDLSESGDLRAQTDETGRATLRIPSRRTEKGVSIYHERYLPAAVKWLTDRQEVRITSPALGDDQRMQTASARKIEVGLAHRASDDFSLLERDDPALPGNLTRLLVEQHRRSSTRPAAD